MTRTYDTRSREEILAAPHFAPFLEAPRLGEIGLRELRTLDRFFTFAAANSVATPKIQDFLNFAAEDSSPRRLENLRTALDRLLPVGTPVLRTVRDAIRVKRPRSRVCDRTDRETLLSEPLLAPYRDLPAMADLKLEDLRAFVRFLEFAEARSIEVPSVEDYLAFASDVTLSRRLRSLKTAIETLMPGSPAAHVILADAIAQKSPASVSRAGTKSRSAATRRVEFEALPENWRAHLRKMQIGAVASDKRAYSTSVLQNMTETLREYAKVQIDAGVDVAITIDGIRRMEARRTALAPNADKARYMHQGNRPATRHTAVMRLRQFAESMGIDTLTISAIRMHENALRKELNSVVSLKFARYDRLPGLNATWRLAHELLEESRATKRQQTKLRLINEAFCIAFWSLIPLRLADGQLLWERDISLNGTQYRIDIDTRKAGEPLRGCLHPKLAPFLDALLCRGMNDHYLEHFREEAISQRLPLLRDLSGKQLSKSYPSAVWRRHMGTGAHIARTRIHSELGQLGAEGVEIALAINAQRDQRTQKAYQTAQVARAQQKRGQEMINDLLAEAFAEKPV
ncbi:MAG: hypothetical protein NXH94_21805 [Rhodobacteraceae bacterium]|uniref:hypothetical protein n=1 Tax=Marivita sp. TaxID=2003365 RepID=UPI003B51896E|nr:hypothetical protein [Paracoccaceae bacterium]